jgi:hypothetical protein
MIKNGRKGLVVFTVLGIFFLSISIGSLPSDIQMKQPISFAELLFLILGLLFLFLAAAVLYSDRKDRIRISRLKAGGFCVKAKVMYVAKEWSVDDGGDDIYYVHADYTDPETGKTYHFRSERLIENPGEQIVGWYVPVYMEPGRYDYYYMEVNAIYLSHPNNKSRQL